MLEPYNIRTKVRISIMDSKVTGRITSYNYGISGHPSSFILDENELMRYPIERLNPAWCEVLEAPEDYVDGKMNEENR